MHMIREDTPAVDNQTFFFLAVRQAFDYQVGIVFPGKNFHPLYHREGDKINCVLVSDLVAALPVITFTGMYRNRVPPVSFKVLSLPPEDSKQLGTKLINYKR